MPLVSVIIPCYNCENWIKRSVNSVLAQTYPSVEILLIENNSTDNTLEALKTLERSNPEKIRLYIEKKKGAAAARNLGLANAKGEWIQFLDADDELLPKKLENQMMIINNQSTDLIIDDYRKVHNAKKGKSFEDIKSNEDPWLGVINSRLGITSSNLWKKEALIKTNGWNENLTSSQEYDLLFRLLMQNPKIVVNHQIQTLIHAQPESISRSVDSEKTYRQKLNRYNLRAQIYNYLAGNNLLNNTYKRSLLSYLYYHLLLLSEYNKAFFIDQLNKFDFKELSFKDKFRIYKDFIGHSAKRKYGYSTFILKFSEWQFYFLRYLYLLKY